MVLNAPADRSLFTNHPAAASTNMSMKAAQRTFLAITKPPLPVSDAAAFDDADAISLEYLPARQKAIKIFDGYPVRLFLGFDIPQTIF
jgi:hypothetical protein